MMLVVRPEPSNMEKGTRLMALAPSDIARGGRYLVDYMLELQLEEKYCFFVSLTRSSDILTIVFLVLSPHCSDGTTDSVI